MNIEHEWHKGSHSPSIAPVGAAIMVCRDVPGDSEAHPALARPANRRIQAVSQTIHGIDHPVQGSKQYPSSELTLTNVPISLTSKVCDLT